MSDSPPADGAASRLPVLALLVANLLLACGPWLVRLARSDALVGPVAAGFWRLALALPVLLVVAARSRKDARPTRGAISLVVIAGIAFAADLGLWHAGILHARLANATLFGNVPALLFPIYGFIAARTWPRARQSGALLLGAVGAVLLLGRSYELSADHLLGDMLCIGAGLCYTVYLIAIGRTRGRIAPAAALAISVAVGAPLLLGFATGLGEPVWPADWTPLILLALFSQLIGQGLILWALSHVSPLVVGLMLLVQPLVSATVGWLAFGERLAAADLIGAAAVVAAMLLVREEPPAKALPRVRTVVHDPA